jgi:hypothetical protein
MSLHSSCHCQDGHNGGPNGHKCLMYGRDGDEFPGDIWWLGPNIRIQPVGQGTLYKICWHMAKVKRNGMGSWKTIVLLWKITWVSFYSYLLECEDCQLLRPTYQIRTHYMDRVWACFFQLSDRDQKQETHLVRRGFCCMISWSQESAVCAPVLWAGIWWRSIWISQPRGYSIYVDTSALVVTTAQDMAAIVNKVVLWVGLQIFLLPHWGWLAMGTYDWLRAYGLLPETSSRH